MNAGVHAPSLAATLLFAVLAGSGHAAPADAGRKPVHRGQPTRASQSAPDRTGTLAKPSDGPTQAPSAAPANGPVEEALVPVYLPDVPRARMRACGETWRAKKRAGEIGDVDWREFAGKCLTAAEAPASP